MTKIDHEYDVENALRDWIIRFRPAFYSLYTAYTAVPTPPPPSGSLATKYDFLFLLHAHDHLWFDKSFTLEERNEGCGLLQQAIIDLHSQVQNWR